MKILCLHSDYIKVRPVQKAIKDADQIDKKEFQSREALVVFTAVEKKDEENPQNVVKNGIKEILDVYNQVKAKEIVIYPYVHLSSDPASPAVAKVVLNGLFDGLKSDYKVGKMPFGWYKAFEISVKGHPLSELSREIGLEGKKELGEEREKQSKIEGFEILLPNGKIVSEKEAKEYPAVKFIIADESGKSCGDEKREEPAHLELITKLSISRNEPISDAGCYSWFPNGTLIKQLIRTRTWDGFVTKFGALPITTPLIIRKDDPGVQWLTGHFPERQYRVLPGRKDKTNEMSLKTAGDYAVFSIFRDMLISYKQMPIALYEDEQYDHRYEQRGELRGMNRLREFEMHNVHSVCENEEQAYDSFRKVFLQECDILGDLGIKPDAFLFYCEKGKQERYLPYMKELAKKYKVPVVIELLSQITVYMGAWIDYIVLDSCNRPMEICTSQVDFQSAKYWDIFFVDKEGTKKMPYILHTGFGVERTVAALLEILARNKNPTFPMWLSPTQVRLCPVNDSFIPYCEEIAKKMANVRVDVDDRTESVQKKVRDAEVDWVPMIVVVGEKEKASGKLAVRFRETGKVENIDMKELASRVAKETEGYPFKPLPLPRLLTRRPKFVG